MSGCPDCAERPRRWWLWLIVIAAVALAQLVGCGGNVVRVGQLAPSPKIQLAKQESQLALEITAATPDRLRVESDGFVTVEVAAFRQTLAAAFERGFGNAFLLAGSEGPGPRLVIEVRRLSFSTERPAEQASTIDAGHGAAVILTHGGDSGHRPAKPPRRPRYAVIEFSAALHDGQAEVRRISGQASSQKIAGENADAIGEAISSAVATMFELIARDLFTRHMATLSPG